MVTGFLLPWVTVEPRVARQFRERVHERLEQADLPSETAEDWRRLADLLVDEGEVSGLDVFHWARTARREAALRREAREAAVGAVATENPYFERATLVVGILLLALPLGGGFVFLYLLTHALRRARAPVLVAAALVGVVAVAFPAVYRIAEGVLGDETDPAPGLGVLLASGFALFLSGAFGVKPENWWKAFLGFLVVGGGFGLWAWVYVRGGVR